MPCVFEGVSVLRSLRMSAAALLVAALCASCGGGGSTPRTGNNGSPIPVVTPSATASGTFDQAAFTCPTSDTASAAVARSSSLSSEGRTRFAPRRATSAEALAAHATTSQIMVTYRSASTTRSTMAAREQGLGATVNRTLAFSHIGLETHFLTVPTASASNVMASLRSQSGVVSVATSGGKRFPLAVDGPYYTNDPYFQGFTTTNVPSSGATAPPATYHVRPFVENSGVAGQWEAHVTRRDYAFEYGVATNGSGKVNANALGSSGVRIAVIDTGADTTHPELANKITYQRCFITNPSGVQSTSNFTTDEDGHGTDVAGIAAAQAGNGLGFAGAGGNSVIADYRVQPTPDDNCTSETTTDDQCGASTADIASAITDAVNQGVNVISMSLGSKGGTGAGDSCTSGVDPDTAEGNAVANAIAANIVVVAASGNSGLGGVSAPACDSGVIAVGASALSDGMTNGSNNSSGTAASPAEYVASYSNYGATGAAPLSSGAWGIVAPGGDPTSTASSNGTNMSQDDDQLHWIFNIWTSTPFMANTTDMSFEGECLTDYPASNTSGTIDCRTLIAGTSMSTPQVAGAAALIIAVNPTYQSPTLMKQLLCSTAHDIGDAHEGCGRLDVYSAMASALGDNPPPASQI